MRAFPAVKIAMSYVLFLCGNMPQQAFSDISAELWLGENEEVSEVFKDKFGRQVQQVWFLRFLDSGENDSRVGDLRQEIVELKVGGCHWLSRFIEVGLKFSSGFGCIELGASEGRKQFGVIARTVDRKDDTKSIIYLFEEACRKNTTMEFVFSVND